MIKQHYQTTNNFQVRPLDFKRFTWSDIKSQRDDFNDMFVAEQLYRESRRDLSLVFCLSYNDEHLHIAYGHPQVDSHDLSMFAKSSAWCKQLDRKLGYTFDFVCVAEYGEGGKSHNCIGKRGKGNNPHFHCVGWFHQKRVVDFRSPEVREFLQDCGITATDHFSVLSQLVRYNWQRDLTPDIITYAHDFAARAKGLGFVSLDGSVRCPYAGGAYVGKYIGKDIKQLYYDLLTNKLPVYLLQNFANRLCSLGQKIEDVSKDVSYWYHKCSWNKLCFTNSEIWFDLGRYVEPLNQSVSDNWLRDEHTLASIFDILTQDYLDLTATFIKDMRGRYSPKVRKFHGFGYHLFRYADLEKGTYYIPNPIKAVTRFLPPSLFRYAYYDHFQVIVGKTYDSEKKRIVDIKQTKYVLNDAGHEHLKRRLSVQIDKDLLLIRNFGSINLKNYGLQAALFLRCCFHYEQSKEDTRNILDVIKSKDAAIDYAISCRPSSVYEVAEPERRTFIDPVVYIKNTDYKLYCAVTELQDISEHLRSTKNNKDKEFIDSWMRVYCSTF